MTITFTTLAPPSPSALPGRLLTGFSEVDIAIGDATSQPPALGFARGGVYLFAGDPGAGKSTLALQIAAHVARTGSGAAYVTAEESDVQVQARAARLGLTAAPVRLAATDDLRAALVALIHQAGNGQTPPQVALVVLDSAQRFRNPSIKRPAGSNWQVLDAAHAATEFAGATGAVILLICHETKSRSTAGPLALQHDVDAVLHLETVAGQPYRCLKASKNRYGATDGYGLLGMTPTGLVDLPRSAVAQPTIVPTHPRRHR